MTDWSVSSPIQDRHLLIVSYLIEWVRKCVRRPRWDCDPVSQSSVDDLSVVRVEAHLALCHHEALVVHLVPVRRWTIGPRWKGEFSTANAILCAKS